MSNFDESGNNDPKRYESRMGTSTPLSGAGEVDCDEMKSHVITGKMSQLSYDQQFHIAYSVCGILDLYPGIITDIDTQESFEQIQNPVEKEAWKQFFLQQQETLKISIH